MQRENTMQNDRPQGAQPQNAKEHGLTRRDAIRLGVTAAAIPAISTVTTAPSYAASASTGQPILLDNFTLDQADNNPPIPSDGSFAFGTRSTDAATDPAGVIEVVGGILRISKGPVTDAPNLAYRNGGPSLSNCTEIVLQNTTEFGNNPRIGLGGPGGFTSVPGTVVGNEIIFSLATVDPATLAAPFNLLIAPDGTTAIASQILSTGPLIAR